jgi:[ribosomal protein S18]-alanine N-acetyltransferase
MMNILTRLFARSEPVLSEARPRDALAMAALHAASFRRGWSDSEFEQLLSDRAAMAHRAILGRRLVGFIISRLTAGEAEILSVAVDRSCQGRGIAAAMLLLHLRRLATLNTRAVFLEVDENNMPACRLYASAGFHEVARRASYYRDGDRTSSALVLRRDLA